MQNTADTAICATVSAIFPWLIRSDPILAKCERHVRELGHDIDAEKHRRLVDIVDAVATRAARRLGLDVDAVVSVARARLLRRFRVTEEATG